MKWLFEWMEQVSKDGDFTGFGVWLTFSVIAIALAGTLCTIPVLLILWGAGRL